VLPNLREEELQSNKKPNKKPAVMSLVGEGFGFGGVCRFCVAYES